MKTYIIIAIVYIILMCIASFVAGAKWLRVRNYYIATPKLLDNGKITRLVFISDLHERSFGTNNEKLIEKIDELAPDAIFIGGDTVDTYGKVGGSYEPLFRALPNIAKTFLVVGNHEYSAHRDMEIIGTAENCDIRVLDDEFEPLECNGNIINIIGMADYNRDNVVHQTMAQRFDGVAIPHYSERFNIVLSHRPCELEAMSRRECDLMLCGHTHGGQMRLPFVGGVFTPSCAKLFPKYDMGYFGIGKMDLIISAGLGASTIPLRFMNRPEITVIDLQGK